MLASASLMGYLGHGVTPVTILREGADMARRYGAPHDIIARMDAGAAAYAATGEYPAWAEPVQMEKRHTYTVEKQLEESGT